MATFLLVHGACAGGWVWKYFTPLLQAAGHDVHFVTLTGLGDRAHLASPSVNLDTHIQDVTNALFYEDLTDVILVGQSYGGMIISGAIDRCPERIREGIYLDAMVPIDGERFQDLRRPLYEWAATSGHWLSPNLDAEMLRWVDPDLSEEHLQWMAPRMTPQSMATLTQPIRLAHPDSAAIPHTYIRCLRSYDEGEPLPTDVERVRTDPAWRYIEIDGGHVVFVANPPLLADVLLSIAQ